MTAKEDPYERGVANLLINDVDKSEFDRYFDKVPPLS